MIKLTYNSFLFFRSESLGIVEMKIDNILILVDNNFASIKEKVIKLAKIMTINRKYFTSTYPLKFNGIEI